jgi:hypothetical protein
MDEARSRLPNHPPSLADLIHYKEISTQQRSILKAIYLAYCSH